MDHALPHGNGNHNDFIQIGAGGPWTIDANWFGVRTGGAASIWLDPINGGLIHDAVISNNVVTGHDAGQYVGIFVGGDGTSAALLPRNVTRDQQHRHLGPLELAALRPGLRDAAARAAAARRQQHGRAPVGMCDRIRSGHNVFGFGQACSADRRDRQPAPRRERRPDRREHAADQPRRPAVAPPLDFFGYARTVGPPDIGAIEFGAARRRPRRRQAARHARASSRCTSRAALHTARRARAHEQRRRASP